MATSIMPASGEQRAAEVAGDRLHRILAEFSARGTDAWSSAWLCAACPQVTGVNGAGVMFAQDIIARKLRLE
jgi:hypothetical protein